MFSRVKFLKQEILELQLEDSLKLMKILLNFLVEKLSPKQHKVSISTVLNHVLEYKRKYFTAGPRFFIIRQSQQKPIGPVTLVRVLTGEKLVVADDVLGRDEVLVWEVGGHGCG